MSELYNEISSSDEEEEEELEEKKEKGLDDSVSSSPLQEALNELYGGGDSDEDGVDLEEADNSSDDDEKLAQEILDLQKKTEKIE